jgi:hypothetical protein
MPTDLTQNALLLPADKPVANGAAMLRADSLKIVTGKVRVARCCTLSCFIDGDLQITNHVARHDTSQTWRFSKRAKELPEHGTPFKEINP